MNRYDPSEESLPEDQARHPVIAPDVSVRTKIPVIPASFQEIGRRSGLGPLTTPGPTPPPPRMGAPFSERFDRSIDEITSPPSPGASAGGGGGSSGPYPFDVSFTAGSDSSHKTATVRPGTLNGLVPTNILTTADLDVTLDYYLILSGVAADGEISSCSLSFSTSAPSPMPVTVGEPPTSFDYVLGMILGDGSACTWYRTIGNGSLQAIGSEVFRVPKASPSPGTLPYDLYWTWLLSNV